MAGDQVLAAKPYKGDGGDDLPGSQLLSLLPCFMHTFNASDGSPSEEALQIPLRSELAVPLMRAKPKGVFLGAVSTILLCSSELTARIYATFT